MSRKKKQVLLVRPAEIKDSRSLGRYLSMAIMLTLVITGLVFQAARSTSGTGQEIDPRREWPNGPKFPPLASEHLAVDLSGFPPAFTSDPVAGTRYNRVRERTKFLVEHHPDPDLRETLPLLLDERRAYVSLFDASRSFVATFGMKPAERLREDFPDVLADKNGNFILFQVNGHRIAAINSQKDALVMLVFLEHEWLHYKQYKAAVDRGDLAEANSFGGNEDPEYMDEAACAYSWEHEVDAWRESCIFAAKLGVDDYFNRLCPWAGDEKAFRQAMFNYNPNNSGTYGYKECAVVNARLSGHPYPEAFR